MGRYEDVRFRLLLLLAFVSFLAPEASFGGWGRWVTQGSYDARDREFIAALMDPAPAAATLTTERINECMLGTATPPCFRCPSGNRDCFQGTGVQLGGKSPTQIRESGDYSACFNLQPGQTLGMHQFACASRRYFEGGWVNVPTAEIRSLLIESCRENGQVTLARFSQCSQNITSGARAALEAAIADGSVQPRIVSGNPGAPELSPAVLAGIEAKARLHCGSNTACISEFKLSIRNFVNLAVMKSADACAEVAVEARSSCVKLQASYYSTEFEQASLQFAQATRFSRLFNFMAGACQEAGHNAGCMTAFPASSLLPVDGDGNLPLGDDGIRTPRLSAMCRPPTVNAAGTVADLRACPQLEPRAASLKESSVGRLF